MKFPALICLLICALPASALSPTETLDVPGPSMSHWELVERPMLVIADACNRKLPAPTNPVGERADELTLGVLLAARESGIRVEIVEEEVCRK